MRVQSKCAELLALSNFFKFTLLLKVVLPQYRGADTVAIYAVYPCRDFMPTKVNALIEFLADLYGSEPYWDKAYDGGKANAAKPVPKIELAAKAVKPTAAVAVPRAPTLTR